MKDVSAGIIIYQDKILIAKRKHQFQNDLWEFPGGKVEKDETVQDCLKRETKEELGMYITVAEHFMDSIYNYESGSIRLIAYFAFANNMEVPYLKAHSEARWVLPVDLDNYEFAPADVPIKNALKSTALKNRMILSKSS